MTEECAELTQCCTKILRKDVTQNDFIIHHIVRNILRRGIDNRLRT